MSWIQVHLTISREQIPLMELLLENLGALSITMEDAADEPMLEPAPGETPLWTNTRITGLYTGVFEEIIRKKPENWFWLHRRWR